MLQLVQKLKDELTVMTDTSSGRVINIVPWLSHTTLDAIGEAGFNLKLGALNSEENELTKVYHNLLYVLSHYSPFSVSICHYQARLDPLPTGHRYRVQAFLGVHT